MRQRLHERGVHRQRRVEQMGEVDAQRLRHQPKEIAVAVEAPRPPLLDDFQPRFVVPVEDLAAQLAAGRPVDELHRVRADPARAHHRDQGIGHDAAHGGRCLQVFQLHRWCLCTGGTTVAVEQLSLFGGCLRPGEPGDLRPALY